MSILGSRSQFFSYAFRTWSNVNSVQLSKRQSTLSKLTCTNKKSFIHLEKGPRYMSTMFNTQENLSSVFRFTDYDCIGFDLDNTLSRYKVGAMIEMEYELMAKFLVEKKGYSQEHLLKNPFDHNFILRGLIVDDENGNILRIGPDGYVLQASHGTTMLKDKEIEEYYPNRHWEPSDVFVRNPLKTWNGPYSERMRTLLDYFDIAASLLFARAIDLVDQEKTEKQSKYYVWLDVQEALQDMFNRQNFPTGEGGYFAEIKSSPDKYYHECSKQLLKWLKNLKEQNKLLFVLTGSNVDFASHTAFNTLGPDWRDYFDIVVCFAKKPGFFTMERDFLRVEGHHEGEPVSLSQLELGGLYSQGNWTDLHKFLTKHVAKDNPKFLYVGDNLIQDIFTPHIHSQCDTVAVCEELEAEGVQGYERWHPDQEFLTSTVWGSYFKCNNVNTNWYDLMKKHSRLCVPSIEYVAALPIDHEFQGNDV